MYAVFHLPNFLVQAAVYRHPELREQAFVLTEGEVPAEIVVAANRAARALGVEIGITRLQAESFPGVRSMRRSLEDEGGALDALHAIACRFSPRIEYVAQRPGTYALDVRGMERLFGNAMELAGKLREAIRSDGFFAQVAIAHTFHAAVCLASGRRGITIAQQGREAEALAGLPIEVLELTPAHAATFASWGIRTCGELAALAEEELIARIGQVGKRMHALARGAWPHLMIPVEPNFEAGLVERMELDFPVDLLEPLLFLLARMTDALLHRVKEKARAIAMLRVVLQLDGGRCHERIVRPALPLQDTPTLLKLMQLDLEMHPPGAAILALELHAQSADPYRAQHGLFLPQAPEPGRLEVLLARLRKLLGEQRVGSPELLDDHRPDAFRMVPFIPPPPRRTQPEDCSTPTSLRACRPPQAVGVMLAGNAPARVFWNGVKYSVSEAAGPWRVSGQWWNAESWSREEWDVHLVTNAKQRVCRMAFDPSSGCWYVQGTYD